MTKSEIQYKQICLLSIFLKLQVVGIKVEKLLGLVRLNRFSKTLISIRFNLLQFFPSVVSVVSVILF